MIFIPIFLSLSYGTNPSIMIFPNLYIITIITIRSSVSSSLALWGCFQSTSPARILSTPSLPRCSLSSLCCASSTQCSPFSASPGSFSFGPSISQQIIEGKSQHFSNRPLAAQSRHLYLHLTERTRLSRPATRPFYCPGTRYSSRFFQLL